MPTQMACRWMSASTYMANAAGRLLGTVCSGWIYQAYGLSVCLTAVGGFYWLCAGYFLRAAAPPRQSLDDRRTEKLSVLVD